MTLDELQKIIFDFVEERKIGTTVEHRMLDLLSEAGELSKEVLKSTDYGKKSFEKNDAFKDELGDVFFSLVCMANQTDTNLEELIKYALEKYRLRFIDHNHIGSVNKKA